MQRDRRVVWFACACALVSTRGLAQTVDCKLSEVTGFTEPAAMVEIAAREPGIVAQILVEPGDHVKAGEVIAELDKTLAKAELESARGRADASGRLSVAEAKLDQASRRMEEMAKLEKSRATRPLEVLTAKAELAIAQAEVKAAQDERRIAQLDTAGVEARLSLLDVRAPFEGVVNEVHRRASELVGAGGDARVVTLFKLDSLHADFFAPAGCIGAVGKGAELNVKLARLDRPLAAHVRYLGLEIDAPTGMRRINIEIDNPNYDLLGGERLVLALPIGGLER